MSYRYYGAPIIKYEGNRASMVLRGLGDPVLEDLKRANFDKAMLKRFGAAAVRAGVVKPSALGNQYEEFSVDTLTKLGIDPSMAETVVNAISDFGGALMAGKNLVASTKALVTAAVSQAIVVALTVAGSGMCLAVGAAAGVVVPGAGAVVAPLCIMGLVSLLETIPIDKIVGPLVGMTVEIVQSFELLFTGRFEGFFSDIANAIGKAWDQLVLGITGQDWDKYHTQSGIASDRMMRSLVEMGALVGMQERTAILTVMQFRNKLAEAAKDPVVWDYNQAKSYFESRYWAYYDAYPRDKQGRVIFGPGVLYPYAHSAFVPLGGTLRKILPLHRRSDPALNWQGVNNYIGVVWPRTTDPELTDPTLMRTTNYAQPGIKQHHFTYYVPFAWMDQSFDQNYYGYPTPDQLLEGGAPNGRPKDGPEYFKPMAQVLMQHGGWSNRGKNASINRIAGPFQCYILDLKQRQLDVARTLVEIQKALVDQYADKISQVTTAYNQMNVVKSAYDAKNVQSAYLAKSKFIQDSLQTQAVQTAYVKSAYARQAAAAASQQQMLLLAGLAAAGGLGYYLYTRRKK